MKLLPFALLIALIIPNAPRSYWGTQVVNVLFLGAMAICTYAAFDLWKNWE